MGAHDVRVVERPQRPGFADEPLDRARLLEQMRRHDLERELPLHQQVLGQVDLPHAADAEVVEHLVLIGDDQVAPFALGQAAGLKSRQ